MREIKFRAWDLVNKEMIDRFTMDVSTNRGPTIYNMPYSDCDVITMQYTGLKDKNGTEIWEGDLLNVFFTSSDGEHIHDCIYEARIDNLYGITLYYKKLLWESYGHNQYPTSTTLTSRYDNLDNDYKNQNYNNLAVQDTWNENHLLRNRWKGNDYSNYIEIIGNIHENPELLNED